MKRNIKIISGSELLEFEKKCNAFLDSICNHQILNTELVVITGGFYLKIDYLNND